MRKYFRDKICLIYLRLMIFFMIFVFISSPSLAAISHQSRNINGTNIEIILVDMNDKKNMVSIALSQYFPDSPEPFNSMIIREQPIAAINGTFFCNDTYKPVGDIVINGKLRNEGRLGTAVAITSDNEVNFIKTPTGYGIDWSGYETVLACGPRLVKSGRISVTPQSEGFNHVPGSATRSAIGLTFDKKILFVVTRNAVTLDALASIMVSLNSSDAINLDGGASTALYYRNKTIISPGRPLTNVIIAKENTQRRKSFGPVKVRDDKDAVNSIKNAHVQYKNAISYYKNGKLEEAEKSMTNACNLNPTAANYIKLAEIRIKLGSKAGAADAFSESSRLYYEKGMMNEASANAKKALNLFHGHKNATKYYNLAQKRRGKPGVKNNYFNASEPESGKTEKKGNNFKILGILVFLTIIFSIVYLVGKFR